MRYKASSFTKAAFFLTFLFILGCSGSSSNDEMAAKKSCREFPSQYTISIDQDVITSITVSCSWLEVNSSVECMAGAGKYSDTLYSSPEEFISESSATGLQTKMEEIRYSRGFASNRWVYNYNETGILETKTEHLEILIPPAMIAKIDFIAHDETGRPLTGIISFNPNVERCNATEVQYIYNDSEMTLVTKYAGGPEYTGGIDCKFIDKKIQYDKDNNKLSETYLGQSESFIYTITAKEEICAH